MKVVGWIQLSLILVFFSPIVWAQVDFSLIEQQKRIRAEHLIQARKWKEAWESIKDLLKTHEKHRDLALMASDILIHLGERREAVVILLRAASKSNEDQPTFFVKKAKILSRVFITNQAYEDYQAGVNFLILKKYRNARERFQRVISKDFENYEAYIRVAQCDLLAGEPELAVESIKKAIALNPSDQEGGVWLGRARLMEGKLKDALSELQKAQRWYKHSEVIAVWLAEAHSALGDPFTAGRVLENDIRMHPHHILSLYSLAKLRYQSTPANEAILWAARRDLQLALSRFSFLGKEDFRLEGNLSYSYLKSKDELREDIQKLLQLIQEAIEEVKT